MQKVQLTLLVWVMVVVLSACASGTSSPTLLDGDALESDADTTEGSDALDGDNSETADGDETESETADNDSDDADTDSAESEIIDDDETDNDTADGDDDSEADTDDEDSDQDSETTSSALPIFQGFSAASGRMSNSSVQLVFSFAPATLAAPSVSTNGSVRLLSTVTTITK